jgi:opacity protein-like surface antigen
MKSMNYCRLVFAGCAIALTALMPHVAAADPLGFYLGAGTGHAAIRVDTLSGGTLLGFSEKHLAWKGLLGLRPISLIGAEYEYLDFGRASATAGSTSNAVQIDAQQRGSALFAVGYLPLPLPLFDIYGKAGYARIQTRADGTLLGVVCVLAGCNRVHEDRTDTRFAWGVGAQLKLPVTGLSVRAEYERFDTPNGKPDAVTASLLWRL